MGSLRRQSYRIDPWPSQTLLTPPESDEALH